MDEKSKGQAKKHFAEYLQEGLIRKEMNETAKAMYSKNADLSLNVAEECMNSSLKPYI